MAAPGRSRLWLMTEGVEALSPVRVDGVPVDVRGKLNVVGGFVFGAGSSCGMKEAETYRGNTWNQKRTGIQKDRLTLCKANPG